MNCKLLQDQHHCPQWSQLYITMDTCREEFGFGSKNNTFKFDWHLQLPTRSSTIRRDKDWAAMTRGLFGRVKVGAPYQLSGLVVAAVSLCCTKWMEQCWRRSTSKLFNFTSKDKQLDGWNLRLDPTHIKTGFGRHKYKFKLVHPIKMFLT